jgi:trehalose 2-sulfotransferase
MTQITDRFAFEFDEAPEVRVSYMICSLPRSGSSLLCEYLAGTLQAGMPAEYFRPDVIARLSRRWRAESFDRYLRALMERKTSPNGVFGIKAHWGQYREAVGDREPASLFPNLHFVEVSRTDRLRQAISWVRALQTGNWSSLMSPAGATAAVFDRDEIERRIARLDREQAAWLEFFRAHSTAPHRITYEELADDPERTIRELFGYLGVEPAAGFQLVPAAMERQSDELSEEWVARYLAE